MSALYINELISMLKKHGFTVKVFAGDVKMRLRIVHAVDCFLLQNA